MKLCFPVLQEQGLESTIYDHFASAPVYLMIDTDTAETVGIPNCDEHAPDAGCDPYKALMNKQVGALVVGGIGDGFLEMLNILGITVLQAQSLSVKENVELFRQDALAVVDVQNSADEGRCDGEDGDHACDHSHNHEDDCNNCEEDDCSQCSC